MVKRLSPWLALFALFCAVTGVVAALHWPLPLVLTRQQIVGPFHGGHVWCFDHIARMVGGQEPWSLSTGRLGFPLRGDTRFIAWAPALVAVPLRALMGPLGAYNVVLLLSPAATAGVAWLFFRRVGQVGAWTAAGGALAYALCPYALGSLANGQIAKINLWIFPIYFLAFRWIFVAPRRLLAWICLVLATLVVCFTSPSMALFIPLAAVCWGLGLVLDPVAVRWRRVVLVVALLAVTAVSMLPSWFYYQGGPAEDAQPFAPGPNLEAGVIPIPAPMAQPGDTFLGNARREFNPELSNHVTFLTFPLLFLLLVTPFVRFPGRGLAWGAVCLGVVVALGPWLVVGDEWVRVGGRPLALPVILLDMAGYPLRQGGMYYRAIALASLGLAGLMVGLCGRLRAPWGALLAWTLGVGAVADGVRATAPLWPRPIQEVPGRLELAAMAADPTPGAVLDLPMETSSYGNNVHLLAAVFHGRATTAVAAATSRATSANLRLIEEQVLGVAAAQDGVSGAVSGAASLKQAGYRYAVWRPFVPVRGEDFAWWARRLGFARARGPLRYWVIGAPPPPS